MFMIIIRLSRNIRSKGKNNNPPAVLLWGKTGVKMSRRKRYPKGRIYIADDKIFSRDNYSKQGRRVVAVNNNKNALHVVKIKGLYDNQGNKRKNLVPIEHYNVLTKPSGIDPYVYKKTKYYKPIKEKKLIKTNARLNKWDLKKILHLK